MRMDHGGVRRMVLRTEGSETSGDGSEGICNDFRRFFDAEAHFLVREEANYHVDHTPR
jgi:hypothetical protein